MSLFSNNQDTIAAIATAVSAAQGGIAVVRISGPQSEVVARRVVSIPGEQAWESHRVLYGHVVDASTKENIDEVLILIMKAPRSFTGEDTVEIQCHGGLIVVQQILECVLQQQGVRRALPGEFSQRAVLNGRLELTRAEAISDLVSARSRRAAKLAKAGMDGGIQRRITSLRNRLLDQLSELEARVDFEEDLPLLDRESLLIELLAVKKDLLILIEDAKRAALVRKGLRVALVGRPNVGKSSLLNRLSRLERAIVTDIPGTTRDLLESEIVLSGVPITLLDTAGIRATDDALENLGIDRSYKALASADVVLFIFDLTLGWTDDDQALFHNLPDDVSILLVGNKIDLNRSSKNSVLNHDLPENLALARVSAMTGEGEQELVNALLKACGSSDSEGLLLALNQRQCDLAELAAEALGRSQEVAEHNLPWDFWTIDLRQAIGYLGEITGDELTEEVLDRIFSRFCIGK